MRRFRRYRSRRRHTRPALGDLYGPELRTRVEEHYPGLAHWLELNLDSLYAAIAFGLEWERVLGEPSATGLWLQRHSLLPNGELHTYDRYLEELDQLVGCAVDDAAMSERLARRGLELEELKRCGICGDYIGLGCRC